MKMAARTTANSKLLMLQAQRTFRFVMPPNTFVRGKLADDVASFCANGDGSGTSRSQVRFRPLATHDVFHYPLLCKILLKKELSFLLHTFLPIGRDFGLRANGVPNGLLAYVKFHLHERNAHDVRETPQTGAESSFSSFFHFREFSVVHRKTLSQFCLY